MRGKWVGREGTRARIWRPWLISLLIGVIGLSGGWAAVPTWAATRSGPGNESPTATINAPTPSVGPEGTRVGVIGYHWTPGTTITFALSAPSGECVASATPIPQASATVDAGGTFQATFVFPAVPPAQYHLCALGPGAPLAGLPTTNTFDKQGFGPVTITLPVTAVAGATVTISGGNWYPAGTVVEVLSGPPGGDGCATHLTNLTPSGNDGSIIGTLNAPAIIGTLKITVVTPPGSCTGLVPPTNSASTTIAITATPGSGTPGSGTPGSATPGSGTPGSGTPGSGTPGSGTPGSGTPGSGTPGSGTPGSGTPGSGTPGSGTPGSGTPGSGTPGSGTPTACPPGASCITQPNPAPSIIPALPLCLTLIFLFALLLLLFVLLIRRRNQEVIETEEDITSQIDPNAVKPWGKLRFVSAIRHTKTISDKRSGQVIRTISQDYDLFVDANGKVLRRRR